MPKSFVVYDNMQYSGKPATVKGLCKHINLLSEATIWPGLKNYGTLPAQSTFASMVRTAVTGSGPLVEIDGFTYTPVTLLTTKPHVTVTESDSVCSASGSDEDYPPTQIPTAAAGALLSVLRERSGSLAAPVLAHLAANCTAPLASALARTLAANRPQS